MLTATADPWSPSEPDVMEIEGRLDAATAPDVEEDALLCIQSGARRMVLDCSAVSYLSAAGLRTILTLAHAMRIAGGRFAVCGLQPQPGEMFEACGFDEIVPLARDQAEAALVLPA